MRLPVITLGLVLALLVTCVLAEEFYVATDGSDSNNGTSSSPFLTVAKALDASASGDSIVIGGGQYSGSGNTGLTFSDRDIFRNEDDNADGSVTFLATEAGTIWTMSGEVFMADLRFDCNGVDESTALGVTGGSFNSSHVDVTGCSIGMDMGLSVTRFIVTSLSLEETGVGILATSGNAYNLEEFSVSHGTFHCDERAIRFNTTAATSTGTGGASFWVGSSTFFGVGVDLVIDSRTSASFSDSNFEFCDNFATGGGGLYVVADSVVIQFYYCHFAYCSSSGLGGALYAEGLSSSSPAEIQMEFSLFRACSSYTNGGAIWLQGSGLVDKGSVFTTNAAVDQGGAIGAANPDGHTAGIALFGSEFGENIALWGGAVAAWGFEIEMVDVTFALSRSGWYGGAVALMDCVTVILDTTFDRNQGGDEDGEGGGLFIGGEEGRSVATITGTNFSANFNGETGGGASFFNATIGLNRVAFDQNFSLDGGGFSTVESTITGSDVTFDGNFAQYNGGGYYCVRSTVTLDGVTFMDNGALDGRSEAYACAACISTLTGVSNPTNDTISC